MKRREDTEIFLARMRRETNEGEEVLRGVMRKGACWYQRSMVGGQKLGEPVLAIVTGAMQRLALDGICIDADGATYELHIYPDGVLDQLVTPTEVEDRIKLAVVYQEQRLRATCKRLLPKVLPVTGKKASAA